MSKHLVFVYGTLKEGFHNHSVIESDSTVFVGQATTVGDFRLTNCGFPYMFPADSGEETHPVLGELYKVDDQTLRRLDILEGVDHGHYSREHVEVRLGDENVTTMTYIAATDHAPRYPDCPVVDTIDGTHCFEWG